MAICRSTKKNAIHISSNIFVKKTCRMVQNCICVQLKKVNHVRVIISQILEWKLKHFICNLENEMSNQITCRGTKSQVICHRFQRRLFPTHSFHRIDCAFTASQNTLYEIFDAFRLSNALCSMTHRRKLNVQKNGKILDKLNEQMALRE